MTKENLYNAAESYVSNNHSSTNNFLQNANIAIEKAFVAGALYAKQELSQVNFDFQIPVSFAILTHLTRHRTH
jgi:hypothetical protein